MTTIASRLESVRQRIARAEKDSHRQPGSVSLVAVSKHKDTHAIREALVAGQTRFGENYVQEALSKISELQGEPIEWHFIGSIQTNKASTIAQHFAWVHGIDRLVVAERLSAARPKQLEPLNVCIQVNIDTEATKAGVSIEELPQLAAAIAQLPRLHLRGLMAIPQITNDTTKQQFQFGAMRRAQEQLQSQGIALDTLSMGMSADLEVAIAQGATLVRVGRDIFGPR